MNLQLIHKLTSARAQVLLLGSISLGLSACPASTTPTGTGSTDTSTSTTGDGDGDPTTGDGDGDPATGDGDGDPMTGDGDGDGDGDPNDQCGNGVLDPGEECDDGNDDNFDSCTELCQPPTCDDGIFSTGETDLDCGGICDEVCLDGQMCNQSDDCVSGCADGACVTAQSCADLQARVPGLDSFNYTIDPDGDDGPIEPSMVWCVLDPMYDGGGWTLVLISADDGVDTWTWNNREMLTTDTTTVGTIPGPNGEDYKHSAYHQLPFSDLMFRHTPSGYWAAYNGIGDGSTDVGTFMDGLPSPECDEEAGYAMSAGTLAVSGELCSTDLYFHCGDRDGYTPEQCEAKVDPLMRSTYGPCWSRAGNHGCPLDDSSGAGLGPTEDPDDFDLEVNSRGFGFVIGENPIMPAGDNVTYFEVLVR